MNHRALLLFLLLWLRGVCLAQPVPRSEIRPPAAPPSASRLSCLAAEKTLSSGSLSTVPFTTLGLADGPGLEIYDRILARAKAARAAGQSDFSLPEMKSTLDVLRMRIDRRLRDPKLKKYSSRLHALRKRLDSLYAAGIPYKASVQWVFGYLTLIDEITLKQAPPETAAKVRPFHQIYGPERLKELLDHAPDEILVFEIGAAPVAAFNNLRYSPFVTVGISEEIGHTDGFLFGPSEFAWHDIGHAGLIHRRNAEVIARRGITPDQAYREWYALTQVFRKDLAALALRDTDLAESIQMYLFEVLHERGLPFDPYALADEFNTPLRVNSLRDKFSSGFFASPHLTPQQRERLEEARAWVLHWINLKKEAIAEKALTSRPPSTFQEMGFLTPVQSGHAKVERISLIDPTEVRIYFPGPEGKTLSSYIQDLSLSQVSPLKPSPLTPEVQIGIQRLAYHCKNALPLRVPGDQTPYRVKDIEMDGNGKITVLLGSKLRDVRIPYEQLAPSLASESSEGIPLNSYDVFRLDQILTTMRSGSEIDFSTTSQRKTVEARLLGISGSAGNRIALLELNQKPRPVTVQVPLRDLEFP